MKFVSAQKPTDYANKLAAVKAERRKLVAQLRTLKSEQEALEDFLRRTSKDQPFQFNGDDGYLKVLEWVAHEREDVDDDAVRRIFARLKKIVPLKSVTWVQSKIRDARDDE